VAWVNRIATTHACCAAYLFVFMLAEPIWCVRGITCKLSLPAQTFHHINYCKNWMNFCIEVYTIVVSHVCVLSS
jgi:hypothetical protein